MVHENGHARFEHYFTVEPTSPLRVREIEVELRNGRVYKFKTPSGVYSYGRLDKATEILINHHGPVHGRVLDVGCGYGVIGIVLKRETPSIQLCMSDVNKRAVEFAKINAKDNNVEADIRQGYLYEPWSNETFDHIISNPPLVAGKRVWMELIEGAFQRLNPGGSLQLVAFHNKGGERIREYMRRVFGNAEDFWKEGGVRIYLSVKLV